MFVKISGLMKQWQTMQRLMKDKDVRALLSHPKMQELLRDPAFAALIKTQDLSQIASHPRLASLLQDPEFVALFSRVNFQELAGGAAG